MATTNTLKARHMMATKVASAWVGYTVVPKKGELCFESDTLKFKLGNGTDIYDNLPYVSTIAFDTVQIAGTDAFAATDTDRNINFTAYSTGTTADPYLEISHGTGNTINIKTKSLGNIVTHSWSEVSTAITNAINDLDSSVSADTGYVLTGVTQTDGELSGKTQVSYATIAPVQSVVGDNTWIEVTAGTGADANTYTVSHKGSSPTVTNSTTVAATSDRVYTSLTFDGTGHVTAGTTKPLTNMVTATANLPADEIVVGAGSKGVKTSGAKISTTISDATDAAAATGDKKAPTNKAVIDYVNSRLSSAMVYKGTIGTGGTITALPATHEAGWVYTVKTAGTYAGQECEVGDMIVCVTSGTTANDAHWDVVNGENQVTDNNPTVKMDGSTYTVANVDGTDIRITTENLDYSSPSASGTTTAFIDTVTQTDGKLSATKKTVTSGTTSTSGIVQLVSTYSKTNEDKALTQKGGFETIKKVKTIVADSATTATYSYAWDVSTFGSSGTLWINTVADDFVTSNIPITFDGLLVKVGKTTDSPAGAVTITAPDRTSIANGDSSVSNRVVVTGSNEGGVWFTGGTDKFTVSDGTNSFDVAVTPSVTIPNNYSSIVVAAQSTGTSNVAGTTSATTLTPASSSDQLNISTGNKWITTKVTSGAANADIIQFSHLVGTIATTGGTFRKFSYDNAGHITAVSDVTSSDIGGKLTDLAITTTKSTSAATGDNDSKITITAFGQTATATYAANPIYTDLLKNGNLELILDGNF